jgi:transposase
VSEETCPRVLGLDDFAWKKGARYGTLLVNLRDTLKAALARHQSSLPVLQGDEGLEAVPTHLTPEVPETAAVPDETAKAEAEISPASRSANLQPQTAAERRRQTNRANRLARYEHIVALSGQGLSKRMIARHLHVSRQLVHRFLTAGAFPQRAVSSRRHSKLDPYLPYLRQRWEQGFHNGVLLAREIQAQGFHGSSSLVGQHLSHWRAGLPEPPKQRRTKKRRQVPQVTRHLSARQASWLFITPKEQLTEEQQELLARICQATADLQELYELGQDFVLMVKQRKPRRLDPWLVRAQRSASVELRGFASGIKRDHAAVKAALSVVWSQRQVAGQITRLKMLKRQMYGRAHFELLRSRVLRRA